MDAIKNWMLLATADEQSELAKLAKTTRNYLYQLASDQRTSKPRLAGRIAEASVKMHKKSRKRLPILTRADLVPDCAECPYAQKCLKLKPKGK